jgi:hypothetical protein
MDRKSFLEELEKAGRSYERNDVMRRRLKEIFSILEKEGSMNLHSKEKNLFQPTSLRPYDAVDAHVLYAPIDELHKKTFLTMQDLRIRMHAVCGHVRMPLVDNYRVMPGLLVMGELEPAEGIRRIFAITASPDQENVEAIAGKRPATPSFFQKLRGTTSHAATDTSRSREASHFPSFARFGTTKGGADVLITPRRTR